jgi:DNA polymerase-3 subunit beta
LRSLRPTTPSRKRPSEELEIDYAGDTIEIGFNVTYLIDALANMERGDGEDGACRTATASALITTPDQPGFKYVVMPMRI